MNLHFSHAKFADLQSVGLPGQSLQCSWSSSLELSADGPQTAGRHTSPNSTWPVMSRQIHACHDVSRCAARHTWHSMSRLFPELKYMSWIACHIMSWGDGPSGIWAIAIWSLKTFLFGHWDLGPKPSVNPPLIALQISSYLLTYLISLDTVYFDVWNRQTQVKVKWELWTIMK